MELVFFDTLMAIKGACSCIKQWWIKSGSDILGQYNAYAPLDVEFTRSQVVAAIPGTLFCVWYIAMKHCLANNILGLAFYIQGIEMLSLGSFKTGGILLLLFPTRVVARPYSILGLGDIVIPALALRFDVSRGSKSNYFKTHYVIHCTSCYRVIGFLAAHCIWNGEVKPLLEFDESKTTASGDGDADETTIVLFSDYMLSSKTSMLECDSESFSPSDLRELAMLQHCFTNHRFWSFSLFVIYGLLISAISYFMKLLLSSGLHDIDEGVDVNTFSEK
ncbi:signal peptide peptidase [Artemisia annua]|uniref:Signal peptide peptidase n=1 Tax=Artemisia annua TaxID=35608 RepID=A0A2U1M5Q0_ARTAN|nr:signal peptide peptidase [Artemisia annua]